MRYLVLCDRRLTVWALFICLLLTYLLNGLWYISNFDMQAPRRPSPSAYWWRFSSEPYNMTLLNTSTDLTTLVDRTDFKFLINNRRCDDAKDLFIVVFVHSAPANLNKRQAIRKTWGREQNLEDDPMRVIFLIGEVANKTIRDAVHHESVIHQDIVQGNFLDSYRNLTYKHVMGLKWVTYYCRQAKYVFKTDDDIFVDVFQLVDYLKATFSDSFPPRNLMMCFLIKNPFVKRSQRSKWRVTFKEYPGKYYPPYCSGWGIIMSPDVVFNLYLQSSQVPYFWVDDVHVSGTLAQRVGISHVDFTNKLALTESEIRRWLEEKDVVRPQLFGHPDSDVDTIYSLWNKTVQYYEWSRVYRWRPLDD